MIWLTALSTGGHSSDLRKTDEEHKAAGECRGLKQVKPCLV